MRLLPEAETRGLAHVTHRGGGDIELAMSVPAGTAAGADTSRPETYPKTRGPENLRERALAILRRLPSPRRLGGRLSDHAVTNTWWEPSSLPSWLTEECYVQRIQPLLRGKRVREIASAMHVSEPYAALVRSGRRRPHPRH